MHRLRFVLMLGVCLGLGTWLVVRDAKSWWLWATTPAAPEPVAMTGGRPGGSWRQTAEEFGWRLNYSEALAEARANNKPLMVVVRCIP